MILLIQPVKRARVSEAVHGFKEYIKTGNTSIKARLSKRRSPEIRTIIIPEMVGGRIHECYDLVKIIVNKLNSVAMAIFELSLNIVKPISFISA